MEPLGRDQALFHLLGAQLWQGRLPYRDLFEHKPPGLILLNALVAPLGGLGPALLDLAAALLTGLLVLVWLERRVERPLAVLAAVAVVLLSRLPVFGGFWATGQAEVLQDPLLMGALVLLDRGRPGAAGVCAFGILALKFTSGLVLFPLLLVGRGRLALGVLAPAAVLAVLALLTGTLGPMVDAVWTFNLSHAGMGAVPWSSLPTEALGALGVLVLAAPALVLGLSSVRAPRRAWLPALLLLSALVAVLVQRKLWGYHFTLLVLPCVLLAAQGLSGWRGGPWLLGGALLPSAPALAKSLVPLEDYVYTDFSSREVEELSAFLADHATEGDTLLVWGFEPGLYVHSGLSPACRWLYDYPVSMGLLEDPTLPCEADWLLTFQDDANALEPLPSALQLQALPALHDAVRVDYRVFASTDEGALVLRRVED